MLFHRQRRVGGHRKVLLGGSGGQRGRQQLPPSQSWLTVASQVPRSPRPGGLGWCFGIETSPSCLCSPHCPPSFVALAPLPSLAASAEPPGEGRGGGGTAGSEQRVPMQPSICTSCQRQTGMWGIWCVWGWGKQPGGWASGRWGAGLPPPPVEPCRDHHSPSPDSISLLACTSTVWGVGL